tara:strand:- start:137 stop:1045 length:909 start_codon:yes stop_codon:yes gene_type:complete
MKKINFQKIRTKINSISYSLIRNALEKILIIFVIFFSFSFISIVRKSILIRSIPKSGTQYLRLLISNYLLNYKNKSYKQIDYFQVHSNYFPNIRNRIFWGTAKYINNDSIKSSVLENKYFDFMYDHGCVIDRFDFLKPKKMILLYRNPLDQIVSLYNYKIKQNHKIKHPRDLIKKTIYEYIRNYLFIKKNINNPNAFILTYEELIDNPKNVLIKIIKFLELPLNKNILPDVIESSSIEKVKNTEKKYNSPIHLNKSNKKISFISSGNVGQWKKYFDEKDLILVKKILLNNNINLEEFQLSNN